jgi:hypothetical protein
MKAAKDEIRAVLHELPDDVSMDAALYELQFKASVSGASTRRRVAKESATMKRRRG